jgi:hypothetical protein
MSASPHHKHHAELNRELARHLTDCEIKAHLFAMAEIYDRLAAADGDEHPRQFAHIPAS